jgi:hypothetical protein
VRVSCAASFAPLDSPTASPEIEQINQLEPKKSINLPKKSINHPKKSINHPKKSINHPKKSINPPQNVICMMLTVDEFL